jgi:hypothetical protein
MPARQALDSVAHAEVDATFVCATDAPIRKDQVDVVFTMAEIPPTFHIADVVGPLGRGVSSATCDRRLARPS